MDITIKKEHHYQERTKLKLENRALSVVREFFRCMPNGDFFDHVFRLCKKIAPRGQLSERRRLATTSRDDYEANWNRQAEDRRTCVLGGCASKNKTMWAKV